MDGTEACGELLTNPVCWEWEQVQLNLYYDGSIRTEEDRDEVNAGLISQARTLSALLVSQNTATARNSSQQRDLMLPFNPFNTGICEDVGG